MNSDEATENFHWEHRGEDLVIVCDTPGCEWEGTAYASQFYLHATRRHE